MSTRSGGPQTTEGKAVTRLNAATFGLYSESPVLPIVEHEGLPGGGAPSQLFDAIVLPRDLQACPEWVASVPGGHEGAS